MKSAICTMLLLVFTLSACGPAPVNLSYKGETEEVIVTVSRVDHLTVKVPESVYTSEFTLFFDVDEDLSDPTQVRWWNRVREEMLAQYPNSVKKMPPISWLKKNLTYDFSSPWVFVEIPMKEEGQMRRKATVQEYNEYIEQYPHEVEKLASSQISINGAAFHFLKPLFDSRLLGVDDPLFADDIESLNKAVDGEIMYLNEKEQYYLLFKLPKALLELTLSDFQLGEKRTFTLIATRFTK